MVMGHSLAQWTKWYDLDFHKREAQQAVDAMAAWRENLLRLPALDTSSPLDNQAHVSQVTQVEQPPSSLQSSPDTPQVQDHLPEDDFQLDDGSEGFMDGGGDDDDDDDDFIIDLEDS